MLVPEKGGGREQGISDPLQPLLGTRALPRSKVVKVFHIQN